MSQRYKGAIISATPPTTSTSSASGEWTLAQQMQAQGASAWPVANPDPYFNQVSLLLHGDGTNGSQNNTFLDSSTNNFTITRNGNTTQGTFTPFSQAAGYWSNYFDGTGDYLSVTDSANLRAGTGDYTIEFFVYQASVSGTQVLVEIGRPTAGPSAGFQIDTISGVIQVYAGSTTGTNIITASTSQVANTWYHIAMTRASGSTKLFINGVQSGSTATDTTNYTQGYTWIGANAAGGSAYANGYISNIRYVVGTALYTSNFTPSTTPLTAVTNTSLLTCQSNRFVDNSANNFTITPAGDTKVTAWSPFIPALTPYSTSTNGGSGYFDGSGDYLTTPSSSSFAFSGDFTVECFSYPNIQAQSFPSIIWFDTSQQLAIQYSHSSALNKFSVLVKGTRIAPSTTQSPYSWYHLAVVRSGTTISFYINGVSVATTTDGSSFSNSIAAIGGYDPTSASLAYNGYVSNVRVVNGTAVYTSNFTPPTAPLTAISGTSLLLNFTNAAIYDNAIKNDVETVGNAQISTSVKKYGTGSVYLNNSSYPVSGGDYLTCLATSDLYNFGTGDFTVEMWLNPTGLSGGNYNSVFAFTPTHVNFSLYILYGKLDFWVGGSSVAGGTATISTGAWTHIAIARSGTSLKMFVNGTQDASVTNSTNITGNTGMRLGQDLYDGGNVAFYGYIDDLRITKGVARYTANFVPPIQAFPDY